MITITYFRWFFSSRLTVVRVKHRNKLLLEITQSTSQITVLRHQHILTILVWTNNRSKHIRTRSNKTSNVSNLQKQQKFTCYKSPTKLLVTEQSNPDVTPSWVGLETQNWETGCVTQLTVSKQWIELKLQSLPYKGSRTNLMHSWSADSRGRTASHIMLDLQQQ